MDGASEPGERATRTGGPAKRRARERVGESEGRSPSDKNESQLAWDFAKASWRARQDSNLRPLAPEANALSS